MTWIGNGNNPPPEIPTNWNAECDSLLTHNELTEEVARKSLGRFLSHNIGMLVETLTRKILEPYQRIVVKGWLAKNFCLTVAARSFGKCIDRHALVLTDEGMKEIQHVKVGERIWANKQPQTILGKVENPKEAGFTVTTKRGHVCTGKVGHKVYILNTRTLDFEWCDIDSLTGAETIPIRYGMNHWADTTPIADYTPLPLGLQDHSSRPIVLSEDVDLYYMMGVILGDGSMRQKNVVTICSMDPEIKDAFAAMATKYMPHAGTREYAKRDGLASDHRAYSSRFKTFLTYMGFNNERAADKVFPSRMLSVNKAKTTAFLRGLFDTDGCCSFGPKTNWCEVELSSSSPDVIAKVQSLLLNLGVLSSTRLKHHAGVYRFANGKDYTTRDSWVIGIHDRRSLEVFAREVGFGIRRKRARLDAYLARPSGSIYKHNMLRVGGYFKAKYGTAFRRHAGIALVKDLSVARLEEFLDYPFVDAVDKAKIRHIVEAGCHYDQIKTITPTETETIDIQVDQEECYWSAGFINHNSTIASHFAYLYCLLNPDRHILVCAATFRSSRQIVERVAEWAQSEDGSLLRETIRLTPKGEAMTKRQDLVRIWFKNGSSITAVPLGDPDNLRGFRCNVLLIDEGLLIAQHTINSVLKPFLAGGADATKKQRIRREESRKIAAGLMLAKDKIRFRSDSKMIILSSASYIWEELYKDLYKPYRAIIEASGEGKPKAEENEKGVSSYLVHQLSYEMVTPDLMDAAVLEQIQLKQIPESTIRREYKAEFINESGGFFSAQQMFDCTIPPTQRPCVEIVGERHAEYILAIDPAGGSIGADPAGDHFAMCVLKIVPRAKDGKKVGLVVHQYGCAGVNLEHHIAYLDYILKRFNIVYIVIDSTGGENLNFVKICNESAVFQNQRPPMRLESIDAEFAKEGWNETVTAVQRSYNSDSSVRRIVHNQYFSASIIKAGNDHLRACFEQRLVMFASKAASVDGAVAQMCQSDICGIHNTHPEYHDADAEGSSSMHEFVVYQDAMMDLVKTECALIEVSSSPLGHLTYDLPHHMTRNRKNVNRPRKDNYSTLWLAAWGMKIYLASQELPPPEDTTPEPVMLQLPW